jgi:hypothetical protein
MPGPDVVHAWETLFAAQALLPRPGSVPLAYIGPGAGLDLVGYTMALLAFGVTALSAVLLWPVYAFLRWLRGKPRADLPTDQ